MEVKVVEIYNRDGTLYKKYHIFGNIQHGSDITYHLNGSIASFANYYMGKIVGSEININTYGNVNEIIKYNNQGLREGLSYIMTDQGIIWIFENFKNDKRNGRCFKKYIDGDDHRDMIYENDKIVDGYITFYYGDIKIENGYGRRTNYTTWL